MKRVCILLVGLMTSMFVGCSADYDTVDIAPDEIAILVPRDGDTTRQQKDNSYDLYKDSLVSGKTLLIPRKSYDLGNGHYKKESAYFVYKTKRTPITLTWYSVVKSGPNGEVIYEQKGDMPGFPTETAGSIGLNIGFTISFYVAFPEKYLYWRGTNPDLAEFGNSVLYNAVLAKIGEIIPTYKDEELTAKKADITSTIKDYLNKEYTNKYGVTVTELGMTGGIQFDNPEIQAQIDKRLIQKKEAEAAEDQLRAYKAKDSIVAYERTWIDINMKKALIEYVKAASEKGYDIFPKVVGTDSSINIGDYLK